MDISEQYLLILLLGCSLQRFRDKKLLTINRLKIKLFHGVILFHTQLSFHFFT